MKFSSALFIAFTTCLLSPSLYASQASSLEEKEEKSSHAQPVSHFHFMDTNGKKLGNLTSQNGSPISSKKFPFLQYEKLNDKSYSGPPLLILANSNKDSVTEIDSVTLPDWNVLLLNGRFSSSNSRWVVRNLYVDGHLSSSDSDAKVENLHIGGGLEAIKEQYFK